jgi:hypothetical protein
MIAKMRGIVILGAFALPATLVGQKPIQVDTLTGRQLVEQYLAASPESAINRGPVMTALLDAMADPLSPRGEHAQKALVAAIPHLEDPERFSAAFGMLVRYDSVRAGKDTEVVRIAREILSQSDDPYMRVLVVYRLRGASEQSRQAIAPVFADQVAEARSNPHRQRGLARTLMQLGEPGEIELTRLSREGLLHPEVRAFVRHFWSIPRSGGR